GRGDRDLSRVAGRARRGLRETEELGLGLGGGSREDLGLLESTAVAVVAGSGEPVLDTAEGALGGLRVEVHQVEGDRAASGEEVGDTPEQGRARRGGADRAAAGVAGAAVVVVEAELARARTVGAG